MTTAPEWRIWTEISQKFDLQFIELPDDLLAKLSKDGDQERAAIQMVTDSPHGRPSATPTRW